MNDDTHPLPPPPLHVAVWDGDIDRVRSIINAVCPEEEKLRSAAQSEALKTLLETKDVRGNSALHLAVRIVQPSQQAIVKLLLGRDASVASRNIDGWSCAHDAALCDDEFLLAQLYLRGEKQVIKSVEATQETFMLALEKLPDFEAEIFAEAHSWVPIVSSVLPSDTIRIRKRGSQLRIDSALKGLEGLKWKKGSMSQVYMGRNGGERAGHAVVLNHDNKVFYDVFTAMYNSSVGNIDMALQVSLTTAMSSSSMDATKLEFVKLKSAKTEGLKDGESYIHKEEANTKSRSRQRKCPWPGTTYKMQNFSIEAQLRPIVNSNRKMKQLTAGKETPFDEVQQLVEHFQTSLPYSKDSKGSKSRSCSINDNSLSNDNAGRVMQLEKGQKVEMHLDVIAGDTIRWEYLAKSSNFCFVATCFHDDNKQVICRADGIKGKAIVGAFKVEHNGSFVLTWQNMQKGFTIDRSGVKITYNVEHARSSNDNILTISSAHIQSASSPLKIHENNENNEKNDNGPRSILKLNDDQKCEYFRQNHIPNPFTTTTAFADYFMLIENNSELTDSRQHGSTIKSSVYKMFEDKVLRQESTAESVPRKPEAKAIFGMKNTYRSLTLLPTARKVRKQFEAKVVMAESFPVQPYDFIPVIEFLSTTGEHMKNLDEFFRMKLPPGFPVKFELPMMFTVRVAYTFQKIVLNPLLDPEMFEIPNDYHEVFTLDEVRS